MTGSSWATCLERFAAWLDAQEDAVRAGRAEDVVQFRPDPELPPLPVALAERAHQLQLRSEALATLARDARDAVARQLQVVSVMDANDARTASTYLDARG